MRKFFLVLFVLSITQVLSVNAQNSLNDYKYVVVPHYFDFVAGEDAYRLNTMTRFLLKKQGFNAFMEKEIDDRDYELNKCLALTARMVNIKSALKTKLKLELRNCDDEIVFESGIGTSKVKTYEIAYKKALTAAFETMKDVKYTYTPNEKIISRARKSQSEDEVKELKAEIAKLKKEKKKETTTSTVKESKASKSAKMPKVAKATPEDKTY